ncbi:LuxR family maltose regulon positive regulatory protein [Sphingomonas kyeonggiensis]|uniref:helix-turn-helix transcriptional regulator n=1 Tax=Sphingomonas kyeonggiensis TaxID=1268553 RepID=UPI002781ABC7|nr:LuxR C-terminal-related transcriptional regulator [Sphingomonas kyeonggiensis]MDQ0252403.1 LuxR family maltose regulon positive regulatory protein [Sphingomonas kyeonggiensis]
MGGVAAIDELIPTKVAPPLWMGDQIRRDALLDRLDGALGRRLTLIHAPAGYGKTSLLAQWRRRFEGGDRLVAWLTLERDDADAKRLAQYISYAISGEGEEEGEPASSGMPARAALSAIINRLARDPRQAVLILDDLHCAESVEVLDFLQSLIRLAPRNCHFIIASRDYPRLGQAMLAAEGQLLELSAEDLKFSSPEAEEMLARAEGMPLGDDDVRSLIERTEGWPIALQLTLFSLKRGIDRSSFVGGAGGSGSELAGYLSEQVLMSLPEDVQEVVLRTSLLGQVTGEALNLICDRQDGGLLLERLEQQGVLLSPLSPARDAWRYHQLFAEYLRQRLARRDIGQYRMLHQRLALWFDARGETADAISHAIEAEDSALLAGVLEDAGGWRLIPQGQLNLVERGLARLSAAEIDASPALVLARLYLDMKCGRMDAARLAYDRQVARSEQEDTSPDLWTEIRVVGDILAEYENQPMVLEDLLAREALLRTLPADDHLILANVSESLASKYYEGGWLERAMEPTLAARAHYQAMGSPYSELFTRFHEARIREAQGRLKDAVTVLAVARGEIEADFGARSDLAANCAAFEAELLYEQDRAGEANALLEWALPHMEQSDGWVDVYAAAYFTAAHSAADEGSLDVARALLARARGVAQRRRLRQLELLAELCELELLLRDPASLGEARAFAATIGLDAQADAMAEESPIYRPVAVAAALCRVRLQLFAGAHHSALDELVVMGRWARQHGAGRLLIDLNLLKAEGYRAIGEAGKAQACFDEAVGTAMFQGIVRPFLNARAFVQRALEEALAATPDRFRAQFLKTLSKAMGSARAPAPAPDALNDAEAAILRHLSQGYSNKEIARLIGMSPDTVKYRLKAVFRKIGVNKRRDAVRVSHERGLIDGGDVGSGAF